jgi:ferritin-like metal-binding protein YciE
MPTKNQAAKKTAPKKKTGSSAPNATEPALKAFFIDGIKDLYWAEKKLVTSLPKMQKAATSEQLKACIGDHIAITKTQVARLEQVFELLEEKAQAKKCDAMEGILKEGEGILEETEAGTATRDVGIILASQKVEHYEIASYGGLVALAGVLGLDEVQGILAETLAEEKEADELLTGVAENNVNYDAASEEE